LRSAARSTSPAAKRDVSLTRPARVSLVQDQWAEALHISLMSKDENAGWVTRRPWRAFALFWVLACAISWSTLGVAGRGTGDGLEALLTNPALIAAKFGPSIAGLIFLAIGGLGVRAVFLDAARRAPVLTVVLAVIAPGLITGGALSLAGAFEGYHPSAVVAGLSLAGAAYWIGLRTLLGGGLGEELGLRGVALPLLLSRVGPRKASLLLGVCWTIWHLPVLRGKPPEILLAQLVLTVSVSLILTFLWMRFRPSLSVAIVFHGALNGWAAYAANGWAPELAAMEAWQVIRLAALLFTALALLPLRWARSTG
jgi:uncharacterized protein